MTTDETLQLKDRTAGLIVFGVLEILGGFLFILMVPIMLFSMIASASMAPSTGASMSAAMMVPAILFYLVLAVLFIWLGIGSAMARRWARALWLVIGWCWLIGGVLGLIYMVILFPIMIEQMNTAGQLPDSAAKIMGITLFVFMALFYVLIPCALVLFYRSRHVKATCERKDPRERWTDRCPLPVLAVSLVAGLWSLSMLSMGFYGWAVPFFGVVISGWAGAGIVLFGSLLLGFVAWGTYRLRPAAWWCATGLVLAYGASVGVTFSRVSLSEFYEKMNFPKEQLELMEVYTRVQTPSLTVFLGLWVVFALAYLVYTKRFFVVPSKEPRDR